MKAKVMWYAVSLLYESVHPGQPPSQNLWEERIVLVKADSDADAQEQGESLGKAEECEYNSATGEQVRWQFRRVERVCPIDADTLESGTEVFSRFLRASEVESLLTSFGDQIGQAKSA